MKKADFRLTREVARKLVRAEDASRRERYPFFREKPPLTEADVEAALFGASARFAFWGEHPDHPRPLAEATAGATLGQTITYCVQYTHSDICNGGFAQYFFNSTGNYVHLTINGLEAIGELRRAQILTRAMSRFPNGHAPTDRAERIELIEAIDYEEDWKAWAAPIEDEYYGLDGTELGARIRAYEKAHPSEYFLDD